MSAHTRASRLCTKSPGARHGIPGHRPRKQARMHGHTHTRLSIPPRCPAAQSHHESKHPTVSWDESKVVDLHASTGGVTTQGVAVRGSKKK